MSIHGSNQFINDREVVRAALGRHAAKHLARSFDRPVNTIKRWLLLGVPHYARRDVAEELLAAIERRGAARSEIQGELRCALEQMRRGEPVGPPSAPEFGSAG